MLPFSYDPDIFLEPINDLKLVLSLNDAIQLRIDVSIMALQQKLVGRFSMWVFKQNVIWQLFQIWIHIEQ